VYLDVSTLILVHVVQWKVNSPCGLVNQESVPVTESTPADILATDAYVEALLHERSESEGFGQGPINIAV